jgi:hypothetical protein
MTALDAIDAGFTAFNYGVSTDPLAFLCGIEVCDDTGACVEIGNPNVDGTATTPSGSRRRLFATPPTAGQASFGPTKMTVSKVGGQGSGDDSEGSTSAAHATFSSVSALLVAAVAAVFAFKRV